MDLLNLIWIALGVVTGVLVGAVPGLTGAMAISLTVPLTFGMEPGHALSLLVAMYVGSVSGGLVTATLLRIPGTPASIITTLDGFPMAQAGRPGRALGLGIHASLFGGVFSWAVLVLLARPLAEASTRMGPADMFGLVSLAMVLIAVLSRGAMVRGLLSGALGLFLALPGQHPALGQPRLTFGFPEMDAGFKLLPVLLGLFAISQVLKDLLELGQEPEILGVGQDSMRWNRRDVRRHGMNLVRSSTVGSLVGVLPGIGANVGSILAYGWARSRSREPDVFGKGSEEGIVASESANNATVGGALVPLVALGIPGSVIDAILLGALVIHGLQPGPLLFANHPEMVTGIATAYLLANGFMFLFMLVAARSMARLAKAPRELLIPVIFVLCVVGAFALGNRMFDVWVMFGFGILGFSMERLQVPLAPFVIGFVLSPIAEENLCAALMQSEGSWSIFLVQPLSACLIGVSLVILIFSLWRPFTSNIQRGEASESQS